jgi:hypothetical protein
VLRIGSGNFYNAQQTNNFSIMSLNPPFSGSFVFQNDRNRPTATIQNPFAGAPVTGTPVALVMIGYLQANGRSNYKNNHIWQWSSELEKSFGKDWVAAVGYVGSAGSNLENTVPNWNNPDPGPGAVQSRRPFQYYVDSRDPNTLLPFGTIRRLESWASSNYNALQSRIEKRFSKGLTVNGSFTYQKAMSIAYGANEGAGFGQNVVQNPRNRLADYGRSNIDQRLRFVWSSIYELPWMRGEKRPEGIRVGRLVVEWHCRAPVGPAGDDQPERRLSKHRRSEQPAALRGGGRGSSARVAPALDYQMVRHKRICSRQV